VAVPREANTEKGGERLKSKLGPKSAFLKSAMQDISGDWCQTAGLSIAGIGDSRMTVALNYREFFRGLSIRSVEIEARSGRLNRGRL